MVAQSKTGAPPPPADTLEEEAWRKRRKEIDDLSPFRNAFIDRRPKGKRGPITLPSVGGRHDG